MGFAINTNVDALNTYRNLSNVQNSLSKSLERLSSGLRINQAGDDAAGLTIATQLGAQISGLTQASRNAQDGLSYAQTADGALTQSQSLLQRARDLTVQAANGSNSADSLSAIGAEITSIKNELTRLSTAVTFNGKAVVGAASANAITFQVSASSSDDDQISASVGVNLSTVSTGIDDITSTTDTTAAHAALDKIDTQIAAVSTARANIGAVESQFASATATIATTITNLTAAKSRITDVDMASEMVNYTRANVLAQSGTAMLAQANSLPQLALKLLS